MKLCMKELDVLLMKVTSKMEKIAKNGPKRCLVINIFKICCLLKFYICCFPVQIPYLRKIWFLRFGLKCSLSQPDCRISKLNFLQNKLMKWPYFLHDDTNSWKLGWLKNFWMDMVKNGCGHSGHWMLKLALSLESRNKIKWFFACWYYFRKVKIYVNYFWVGLVKNDHGILVCETIKSVVFQKWIYELSWSFAC